ncbi:MAG: hypothetical protein WBD07_03390 [Vicinamibacterales bacterium]
MRPVNQDTLAEIVDTELRQLPTPPAPPTLLPRVMAGVQGWARRPWYTRRWFTWPLAWQAASIAALCLLGAGGLALLPSVEGAATRIATVYTSDVAGDAVGIAERAEVTMNAAVILWRAILQPFAVYAFGLIALMCLACAAFGALLNHVIVGRTVQP